MVIIIYTYVFQVKRFYIKEKRINYCLQGKNRTTLILQYIYISSSRFTCVYPWLCSYDQHPTSDIKNIHCDIPSVIYISLVNCSCPVHALFSPLFIKREATEWSVFYICCICTAISERILQLAKHISTGLWMRDLFLAYIVCTCTCLSYSEMLSGQRQTI